MVDGAGNRSGAEAVVDVDHRDSARAAVQHRQEGGHPAETGSVPYAGGYGYDRDIDKACHNARQCAFHTGDYDHHTRSDEPAVLGEEAMKAGDADIDDPVYAIAHDFRGDRRLFGNRKVGRTCRRNYDRSAAGRYFPNTQCDGPRHFVKLCVWKLLANRTVRDRISSRHKQAVTGRDDAVGDGRNLDGRLAGAIDNFRKSLAQMAVMIDAREAQILERRLAQKLKKSFLSRLRRCRSCLNLVEQGSELQPVHRPKSLHCVDFAHSRAVI
jgi:hypothetical protein